MTKTVLITGATGNIGTKLRRHFQSLKWNLRLLDVVDAEGVIKCDLSKWDTSWVAHFADVDAVILLAGDPRPEAPWSSIVPMNIDLPLNVYEAAVSMRAKRVIFASSNWTMAGHRFAVGSLPTDREPLPVNAYGASKLVGERIGKSFSDRHGISSINFRIGWCQHGENRPGSHMNWGDWGQGMWLSDRDMCDGFEKAVLAPLDVKFAVLNLMSNNPGMRWDVEATRRAIGYDPKDGSAPVLTSEQEQGVEMTRLASAQMEATTKWLNSSRW